MNCLRMLNHQKMNKILDRVKQAITDADIITTMPNGREGKLWNVQLNISRGI